MKSLHILILLVHLKNILAASNTAETNTLSDKNVKKTKKGSLLGCFSSKHTGSIEELNSEESKSKRPWTLKRKKNKTLGKNGTLPVEFKQSDNQNQSVSLNGRAKPTVIENIPEVQINEYLQDETSEKQEEIEKFNNYITKEFEILYDFFKKNDSEKVRNYLKIKTLGEFSIEEYSPTFLDVIICIEHDLSLLNDPRRLTRMFYSEIFKHQTEDLTVLEKKLRFMNSQLVLLNQILTSKEYLTFTKEELAERISIASEESSYLALPQMPKPQIDDKFYTATSTTLTQEESMINNLSETASISSSSSESSKASRGSYTVINHVETEEIPIQKEEDVIVEAEEEIKVSNVDLKLKKEFDLFEDEVADLYEFSPYSKEINQVNEILSNGESCFDISELLRKLNSIERCSEKANSNPTDGKYYFNEKFARTIAKLDNIFRKYMRLQVAIKKLSFTPPSEYNLDEILKLEEEAESLYHEFDFLKEVRTFEQFYLYFKIKANNLKSEVSMIAEKFN